MVAIAMLFGVLLIIPIAVDMPTVISLLNAYAACRRRPCGQCSTASFFDHRRRARWIVGLDFSIIMSKAMNRSFANVLFGAFGQVQVAAAGGEEKKARAQRDG